MHPELRRIEEQYLALVADLQAGHIGQADALAVLSNLTAIDGESWVWSIDPYSGEFLRALPGQPGQPADPSLFVVSRLPAVQVSVPPHGTPADQVSDFLHPNLRPLPPSPASERATQALSGIAGGVASGLGGVAKPVAGLLRGRGRTVLVLIGALLLVGALLAGRPGEGGEETATVTSLPTATVPPPTIVIPGVDVSPTSIVPEGSPVSSALPSPPSTLAPLPTDSELAVLLEIFASGEPAALAGLLPESERERLDLLPVLGAVRGGFSISFNTPKISGGTVLVQVRAGNPERPARRWNLRLRRGDAGSWVVVSAAKA